MEMLEKITHDFDDCKVGLFTIEEERESAKNLYKRYLIAKEDSVKNIRKFLLRRYRKKILYIYSKISYLQNG